jgi:hypothetical protein
MRVDVLTPSLGLALLAVTVAVGLCGAPCHAAERPRLDLPNAHAFVYAGGALSGFGSMLSIDGRSVAPSQGIALDLEAGYLRMLGRGGFAVGAALRGGTFRDNWARSVGEGRYRLDLRLVSEASWPFAQSRRERPRVIASVAFGPTVARIVPPERYAMIERYATPVGLHAALRLGFRARLIGRHGWYYAMEGAVHRASAYRTAFVRGSAAHATKERYRFQDFSLGAVAGYALSL